MGNGKDIKVLPILEISFEKLPKNLSRFYSFEVKSHYEDKTIFKCPAPLEDDLKAKIEQTAIKAYKVLNMRDYARVDIRLGKTIFRISLEINSLPGLLKGYSDFTKMADARRLGYSGLVYNY